MFRQEKYTGLTQSNCPVHIKVQPKKRCACGCVHVGVLIVLSKNVQKLKIPVVGSVLR